MKKEIDIDHDVGDKVWGIKSPFESYWRDNLSDKTVCKGEIIHVTVYLEEKNRLKVYYRASNGLDDNPLFKTKQEAQDWLKEKIKKYKEFNEF